MFGRCVICVRYIGRNVDRLKLLNSSPAAIFIFYLVAVSPEFGMCVCVCVFGGGGAGRGGARGRGVVATLAGVFGRLVHVGVSSAFGILGEMLIG